MSFEFDYDQAFSRNIGWVTAAEQRVLRGKRIAIAGLGGVGGSHLLTLTRLGVGAFNIADFDTFDLVNFNRQAGATLPSVGKAKAQVLAEMARAINPTLDLRIFEQGVNAGNVDTFLDGADLYVDGLDFFAHDARRMTFAACANLSIPAITAAPLGMGAAVLNFLPERMSFAKYFLLDRCSAEEQAVRFLVGLSPAMLQRGYLVDELQINFSEHRGPSTPIACSLCAGIAACEALKILLQRGRVLAAPWGFQFDAYRNRFVRTWRPGGNANLLQRLTIALARRQLAAMARQQSRS